MLAAKCSTTPTNVSSSSTRRFDGPSPAPESFPAVLPACFISGFPGSVAQPPSQSLATKTAVFPRPRGRDLTLPCRFRAYSRSATRARASSRPRLSALLSGPRSTAFTSSPTRAAQVSSQHISRGFPTRIHAADSSLLPAHLRIVSRRVHVLRHRISVEVRHAAIEDRGGIRSPTRRPTRRRRTRR